MRSNTSGVVAALELDENSSSYGRGVTALPLPLAGEGWGGGLSASHLEEKAPTRRASRVDLPRKRERCTESAAIPIQPKVISR